MSFKKPGLGVLVAILGIVAVAHICMPPWREIFFFNGDSLTLALMAKSVRAGEAFHWTLSSQLFAFPEFVIYSGINLLVPDHRYTLLVNAFVSVCLLFVGYFLIARSVYSAEKARLAALACVALVVFLIYCEPAADVNGGDIANLILFNTYYGGVIISSLLLLAIYNWQFQIEGWTRSKVVLLALAFVVTALTYFSDPLLLLQFCAPFLFCVLVLWWRKEVRTADLSAAILTQVLGLGVGAGLRRMCTEFIGASVAGYVDPSKFFPALRELGHVMVQLFGSSWLSVLEYGVLLVVLIISVRWAVDSLVKGNRSTLPRGTSLVMLFAVVSPLAAICGTLVSGNYYTRYFLPVIYFTIIGLIPLLCSSAARCKKAIWVCLAGLVILIATTVRTVPSMSGQGAQAADVDCFNQYMTQKKINVLGGYWVTRGLDLYSSTGARALQFDGLTRGHWLNNSSPYFSNVFNGIIVERGERFPNHIYLSDVDKFGAYSEKWQCRDFDILYYADGTQGFRMLNEAAKQ
ncbi:hypothetical protein [Paraburkholderia bannensis]|uniref:hypothetical protein n=1 Tax=Paraburkholderia bannensis TaxID=765414 RepID=UPI002AC31155|nr:hypothetical protein [Paraburkholderia bannensis]